MMPDDVWVLCFRSPLIIKKNDETALAYPTQMMTECSARCTEFEVSSTVTISIHGALLRTQ